MTRRPIHVLVLCVSLLAAGPASGITITRVFSGWRDAASFKRISEYFTGRENTGGQVVIRTHPDRRAGYYFLVRVGDANPGDELRFRIAVVRPGQRDPVVHEFSGRTAEPSTVFNLGLTGPDWPDPGEAAVAWKIEILQADGSRVLASESSYLWEKPAAN